MAKQVKKLGIKMHVEKPVEVKKPEETKKPEFAKGKKRDSKENKGDGKGKNVIKSDGKEKSTGKSDSTGTGKKGDNASVSSYVTPKKAEKQAPSTPSTSAEVKTPSKDVKTPNKESSEKKEAAPVAVNTGGETDGKKKKRPKRDAARRNKAKRELQKKIIAEKKVKKAESKSEVKEERVEKKIEKDAERQEARKPELPKTQPVLPQRKKASAALDSSIDMFASVGSSNFQNLLQNKQIEKKDRKHKKIGPQSDQIVGLDCEMVGIEHDESVLARLSVVDYDLNCLVDVLVRPPGDKIESIKDFRSHVTGITKETYSQRATVSYKQGLQKAFEALNGKTIVGHDLKNDFAVLGMEMTEEGNVVASEDDISRSKNFKASMRDTQKLYQTYVGVEAKKGPVALRVLSEQFLGEKIQSGTHDSVDDARTAIRLYKVRQELFEKKLREGTRPGRK